MDGGIAAIVVLKRSRLRQDICFFAAISVVASHPVSVCVSVNCETTERKQTFSGFEALVAWVAWVFKMCKTVIY